MKKSFTLKLLSTVFLGAALLSQSAEGAQNLATEQRRAANRADTPAALQQVYQQSRALPARLQGEVEESIKTKSLGMDMAVPGVELPAGAVINNAEFEAIARTRAFKELPIAQQNAILADLNHRVAAHGGPAAQADVDAAVDHVIHNAAHANAVKVPVAARFAAHAGGGGGHAAPAMPAGMDVNLFNDIIANAGVHGLPNVADKDNVLNAVHAAMAAVHADAAARDLAVTNAINHLGLAIPAGDVVQIVARMNHHVPFVAHGGGHAAPAMPAGMDVNLFNDIIANAGVHGLPNVADKDNVLNAVHAAMVAVHADAAARDLAVTNAINHLGLAIPAGDVVQIVARMNHHVPFVAHGGGHAPLHNPGLSVPLYTAVTGHGPFLAIPVADQQALINALHGAMGGHADAAARAVAIRAAIGGLAFAVPPAEVNDLVLLVDITTDAQFTALNPADQLRVIAAIDPVVGGHAASAERLHAIHAAIDALVPPLAAVNAQGVGALANAIAGHFNTHAPLVHPAAPKPGPMAQGLYDRIVAKPAFAALGVVAQTSVLNEVDAMIQNPPQEQGNHRDAEVLEGLDNLIDVHGIAAHPTLDRRIPAHEPHMNRLIQEITDAVDEEYPHVQVPAQVCPDLSDRELFDARAINQEEWITKGGHDWNISYTQARSFPGGAWTNIDLNVDPNFAAYRNAVIGGAEAPTILTLDAVHGVPVVPPVADSIGLTAANTGANAAGVFHGAKAKDINAGKQACLYVTQKVHNGHNIEIKLILTR